MPHTRLGRTIRGSPPETAGFLVPGVTYQPFAPRAAHALRVYAGEVSNPVSVAVIGACCTRDAFNSAFVPDHKEHFHLAAYEFQPSLISLCEAPSTRLVELPPHYPAPLPASFRVQFAHEMDKEFIVDLVRLQPQLIVVDLYADIFWGVHELASGAHLTARPIFSERDHLARAEAVGHIRPDTDHLSYLPLFDLAARRFADLCSTWLPDTVIALNGVRFHETYHDPRTGELAEYRDSHVASTRTRNTLWNELDRIFVEATGAVHMTYPDIYDLDPNYPFGGLGEVHYVKDYYRDLSARLREIAKDCNPDAGAGLKHILEDIPADEVPPLLWPDHKEELRPRTAAEILMSGDGVEQLGLSDLAVNHDLTDGWLKEAFRSFRHHDK